MSDPYTDLRRLQGVTRDLLAVARGRQPEHAVDPVAEELAVYGSAIRAAETRGDREVVAMLQAKLRRRAFDHIPDLLPWQTPRPPHPRNLLWLRDATVYQLFASALDEYALAVFVLGRFPSGTVIRFGARWVTRQEWEYAVAPPRNYTVLTPTRERRHDGSVREMAVVVTDTGV